MDIDQALVDQRVATPAETLNVEVKNWIDPATPEGQAKIVRAALALRNRNGGEIIIGFNDKTLQPEATGQPADVRATYHRDKIQELVSKYASDPFQIGVGYSARDGHEHPVIVVPANIRVTVAAAKDLILNGKRLVRVGAVYFRSLRPNNRVSTAEALPGDWREIGEILFNNREADFGVFFRRQLAGVTPEALREVFSAAMTLPKKGPTPCERAAEWLDEGQKRFRRAVEERRAQQPGLDLSFLEFGMSEVALVICGPSQELPDGDRFYSLIARSNPSYTGWPVWLDSTGFDNKLDWPHHRQGAWETFVVSFAAGFSDHVDFSVIEKSGRFYLLRVLQDDMSGGRVDVQAAFDPWLHLYRVAETLAVGLAFAKAMGYPPAETTLAFQFRWTRLNGRTLSGWANATRAFYSGAILGGRTAADPDASACVEVPLETPPSALAPFVAAATRTLFLAFDGFAMPTADIEQMTSELIKRRG